MPNNVCNLIAGFFVILISHQAFAGKVVKTCNVDTSANYMAFKASIQITESEDGLQANVAQDGSSFIANVKLSEDQVRSNLLTRPKVS